MADFVTPRIAFLSAEDSRAALEKAFEKVAAAMERIVQSSDEFLAKQAFLAAGGDVQEILAIEEMFGVTME